MSLSPKGKELRRCQAYTLDGYGPRCLNVAEKFSDYCFPHSGKPYQRLDEDEHTLRRVFKKLYKKRHRRVICQCSSYPFPHPIGAGLCNWPNKPEYQLVITENTNDEETKLKKKL